MKLCLVDRGRCRGVWTNVRASSGQALKHFKFPVIRNGGKPGTFKNEHAYISSLASNNFNLYMLPWWVGGSGEVGEPLGFSFCPGNLSGVLLGQKGGSEMAGDNVWFSLLREDL